MDPSKVTLFDSRTRLKVEESQLSPVQKDMWKALEELLGYGTQLSLVLEFHIQEVKNEQRKICAKELETLDKLVETTRELHDKVVAQRARLTLLAARKAEVEAEHQWLRAILKALADRFHQEKGIHTQDSYAALGERSGLGALATLVTRLELRADQENHISERAPSELASCGRLLEVATLEPLEPQH